MLAPTSFASSIYMPNRGMFIFGGETNNLTTTMNLKSLDQTWENGPALFENQQVAYQCAVQV